MNTTKFVKLFAIIVAFLSFGVSANAQFPIKLPGAKKPEKPKTPANETPVSTNGSGTQASGNAAARGQTIYANQDPTTTPVVIQPRVFIETAVSRTYWKMPNASNTTSWLPEIKVHLFWDDRAPIQTVADWYNPDGSLWFTEPLQTSGKMLRSKDTWTMMDTKSTNAAGIYSVKVKDKNSGAVLYSGKFKVNKFLNSFNTADKNKLGFYVDHDWLLPLGVVNFEDSDFTLGLNRTSFSVWLKGFLDHTELKAQLAYNGKVIAAKDVNSGAAVDERMSSVMVPLAKDNVIKRWSITFNHVVIHNGKSYNVADNKEFFDNAHFIDKNPGKYTFTMLRNGTPVREFSFEVGADGRFVRPAYSDSFTVPYHGILVPAKVIGGSEKWNATSWKTDMFYGNTISGFTVQ
jgi:hypothetical protein